jgi:Bacterial low temperature requirement A protein (LtrA)
MAEATAVERGQSVTTLELFFDLVFVFTITQLTSVLVHEPTWRGLYQVTLMLGGIFWMYGGYAWLTNAVALDRVGRHGDRRLGSDRRADRPLHGDAGDAAANASTPVSSAETAHSRAAASRSIACASTPSMRALGEPTAVGSAMSQFSQ